MKNAATDRFTVKKVPSADHPKAGGEKYVIVAPKSGTRRTVSTSDASAAILDRIAKTHSGALKRLAKK